MQFVALGGVFFVQFVALVRRARFNRFEGFEGNFNISLTNLRGRKRPFFV